MVQDLSLPTLLKKIIDDLREIFYPPGVEPPAQKGLAHTHSAIASGNHNYLVIRLRALNRMMSN